MVRTPCACLLSHFCCVWLSVIPWTITCQAPLSMGFSGQENWGGLPRPPRGDLSNPRTEPASLMSPALEGHFFTPSTTWEDQGPPCNSYYLGVCLFISSFPWAQNLGNEPIPWTSLGNMCAESREEVLITMELSLSCPLARDFLFHFRQDSGKSANTHSQGRIGGITVWGRRACLSVLCWCPPGFSMTVAFSWTPAVRVRLSSREAKRQKV